MAKIRSDGGGGGRKRKSSGGIDVGKFAREVSTNYARGVKKVGKALDRAVPGSGRKTKTISNAMKNAPKSRAAIKKATGRR